VSHPAAPAAFDDPALRATIRAYLEAHRVMTVATAGPWAAAVFYVSDGFDLFFLSSPESRHCAALAASPRVAVTIHDAAADWRAIRGVQGEGVARPSRGAEKARARKLYAAKFPFLREAAREAAIARALERTRWYRIALDGIWFVDNARGFGHRDAVDLKRARSRRGTPRRAAGPR
jgi:hypothetical protein